MAVLVAVHDIRVEAGDIFQSLTCLSSAVATKFSYVARASIFLNFPTRFPLSS